MRTVMGAMLRLAWLIVLAGCGDDPSGPTRSGQAGLTIVAGAAVSDTIDAVLDHALVAAVHDEKGRPMRNVSVRFTPVASTSATPTANIGLLDAVVFRTTPITVRTDSRGRAAVLVRLGSRIGRAEIRVDAADHGDEVTAHFDIEPGAPHSVVSQVQDTALSVGRSIPVLFTTRDRLGNVLPIAPLTFVPASESIDFFEYRAHARRVGRGFIFAKHDALADTMWISVMPQGTLVAYEPQATVHIDGANVTLPPRLVRLDLDGSNYRTLIELTPVQSFGGANTGPQPRWSPSGNEVAYIRSGDLRAVDTLGTSRLILGDPDRRLWHDFSPEYGPRGEWIYFTVTTLPEAGPTLRRVRPDGTGEGPVPADWPQPAAPGPAPTGSMVAYQTHGYLSSVIRLVDAETGAKVALEVPGRWPRWSPTGELIAYLDLEGRLRVMRPDGSGRRLVAGGIFANGNYTWSPDGKWIVISGALPTPQNPFAIGLTVINVESGELLPLHMSRTILQPSWRPLNPSR